MGFIVTPRLDLRGGGPVTARDEGTDIGVPAIMDFTGGGVTTAWDEDTRTATIAIPGASRETLLAGGTLAFGDVARLSGGAWVRARNDVDLDSAWAEAICIEPGGVADGASGLFQVAPGIVGGLSGGSAGALAYVGATPGSLTTTPPSTGFSKIVGKWLDSTTLKFAADPAVAPFALG